MHAQSNFLMHNYVMARRLCLSPSSSKSGKSVTKSTTKRSRGVFFSDVQKPPGIENAGYEIVFTKYSLRGTHDHNTEMCRLSKSGNKCPLELLRHLDSPYLYRRGKQEIIIIYH